MSASGASGAEAVKREIASGFARVHLESYGERASNFEVVLDQEVIAVMVDVEFTPAELTLIGAGRADAVRAAREAYQEAIAEVFVAIVERTTGRRVRGFASRMVMDEPTSWSVEVFRLRPVAADA